MYSVFRRTVLSAAGCSHDTHIARTFVEPRQPPNGAMCLQMMLSTAHDWNPLDSIVGLCVVAHHDEVKDWAMVQTQVRFLQTAYAVRVAYNAHLSSGIRLDNASDSASSRNGHLPSPSPAGG
jgi:hypothetical protein